MTTTKSMPQWATPERKAHLVNLFVRSGGFCVFGHSHCGIASHYYDLFIEALIHDWQADDRQARRLEYQLESIALHSLGEPTKPLTGRWSAISKTIWKESQPLYYVEAMGVSGLTFQPFVKVRLPSSYMHLHVDIADTLRGVSKNKKRKAIRYNKPLPQGIQDRIRQLVKEAITHYLAH